MDETLQARVSCGLGHVIRPHGIDGKGLVEHAAQHRQVDGRVHTLTGVAHLLVVGDIDDGTLVRRFEQFG